MEDRSGKVAEGKLLISHFWRKKVVHNNIHPRKVERLARGASVEVKADRCFMQQYRANSLWDNATLVRVRKVNAKIAAIWGRYGQNLRVGGGVTKANPNQREDDDEL
ncbi:hypothetical protein D8674_004032 [Pyrus ussuriensis x Pyrus communis]|uniref:Uncharacterized protein n=1 Tax=Pyrus ussuriensis x Pyrus communis TaxID=2448454 RepID=A0A5N5FJB3_9ROSA|nr:hypothetical protein D8674_004032 [Pyrus ussuriensis x Pyrus communis]